MTLTPVQELERTFVASALARPKLLDVARVDPASVTYKPYRAALETIMDMRLADERVSPVTLTMELARRNFDDANGLVTQLREAPIEMELEAVAKRLRELARAREYHSAAQVLLETAARADLDRCREIIGRLSLVHDAGDAEQPVMTLGELLAVAAEAVLREGTEQRAMIPLGMAAIDESFKLSAASTLVVGAQTNVGKTSAILTWLLNMAHTGLPVGLVSVEDPAEDYGAKAIGSLTAINPARMWMAKLSSEERALILDVSKRHSSLPFSFAFIKSRLLDDVLARIEFMVRVRGARVIALDYLQAIEHRPGNSPRERIDNTLGEVISLCGRLNVGLILASQLSRPDKGSPFREPHLSDLKESGSIEIRAQCVVLLWRESDKPGEPVKAKVAKVKRVGAGARFELARDPDTGMLVDAATLRPPAARPNFGPPQGRFDDEEGF